MAGFNTKYLAPLSTPGGPYRGHFWDYNGTSSGSGDTLAAIAADDFFVEDPAKLSAGDVVVCRGTDGRQFRHVDSASASSVKTSAITDIPAAAVVVGPVTNSDISTPSNTGYGVAPVAGKIAKIYSVLKGTIATANAAITTKINGTNITGGGLTIAYSGSAAGDVDVATPSAANTVAAGDKLTAVSDGSSTNAVELDVYYVIQPS